MNRVLGVVSGLSGFFRRIAVQARRRGAALCPASRRGLSRFLFYSVRDSFYALNSQTFLPY
jgi:hypothetical protein